MSLVLQSSGGGQITIQEPATASNFTQTLPAASGEVMVSGNQPAFSAIATVDQSLTSGVLTKLNFDGELFDTNSNFASSRFTPTVAGYYQINSIVRISVTNGTNNSFYFYKNGSIYSQFMQLVQSAYSGSFNASGSDLIYLNGTTDYVEIYAAVTGTSPIMNWTADNQTSTFSGFLARAA
jgi:hypothetical protein